MVETASRPPVLLFDVFRTLIAFDGDHVDDHTYDHLARWLWYRGVAVDGDDLRRRVEREKQAQLGQSTSATPDVDTNVVWDEVLDGLGVAAARRASLSSEAPLVYRQLTTRSIEIWPGTKEMLEACAGFRLGVASNTQRAYTEAELRMLGLWDDFEVVVFSSDVRACKPDPAIFRAALGEFDVSPAEVVYVGDNPHDDVLGASLSGIPTILLDRGTPVPDGAELGEPLATVSDGDPGAVARAARAHFGIDP
jgi:putative hydrolase of the HAD superfamily